MTVNIEHVGIDQDTEFACEYLIDLFAKTNDLHSTEEFKLADTLPGGNVVRFLDVVAQMGMTVYAESKNPRTKRRIISCVKKCLDLSEQQSYHYSNTGKFLGFPTSIGGGLSEHLKEGYDVK